MTEEAAMAEIERLRTRAERERRAREQAEALAEAGTRLLYERQQQLQLLHVVAEAANGAASVNEVIQVALDEICAYTNWPVGHAYFVTDDPVAPLVSSKLWHLESGQQFDAFRQITDSRPFAIGEGLPGRVLAGGEPVWVEDVMQDDDFPRSKQASGIGVRGAFAIPVFVGSRIMAVLEFFSHESVAPKDAWLEAATRVGVQVGRMFERRLAEERILAQAELLDKARDAIVVKDMQGRITYWNKSAERLFGWTAEEVLGREALELLSPHDTQQEQEAARALMEKGEWTGELRRMTKSGLTVDVESHRTLIRDSAGQPKSILSINTDISDKKLLATQLLRTQRLESIGTLAGGVAHDLNNALTPIMMATELLRLQYPGAEEIIETVEMSAMRGADMVRQLLTFAKGVHGERLLVQPRHLLVEIEKIIKGTFPKNIQLKVAYAKELETILGDGTQLHQVLLNLCVNARDAMPHGGTLTLEAENTEIDATYASAVPGASPGRYVVWRVTDSGTGIPPEIMERIFEPFYSTKPPDKGTGLGLSTILGIVKSHHGFIQVYSVPGQGSTFAVYLPADGGAAGNAPAQEASQTPFRGNGESILIVDDEAPVREVACSVLSALNFNVLTASDGTEGLIHAAEKRAEIQVVITDMHMPNMDGLTFVRAVKRMLPNASLIVASGRMEERDAEEFRLMGVSALLDKPFTQQTLIAVLRKAMGK
jgi:PAS domain S-box-containing protein